MSRLIYRAIECDEVVEVAEGKSLHQHQESLTASDISLIESVTSPKRRREIAAWRSLLRLTLRELGYEDEAHSDILYDQVGAPYVVDSRLHISISHCSTAVAILLSELKCGVDIEQRTRNFERVASRYTTEEEVALFEQVGRSRADALAIIWSAKEALYKVGGVEGVDFIDDTAITQVESTTLVARLNDSIFHLSYIVDGEYVVVYTSDTSII